MNTLVQKMLWIKLCLSKYVHVKVLTPPTPPNVNLFRSKDTAGITTEVKMSYMEESKLPIQWLVFL